MKVGAFLRNANKSGCGHGQHHFVPIKQVRRGRRNTETSASVSVSGKRRSGRRGEREAFKCRASVTEPEPPQNGIDEQQTFQEKVDMLDRQSDNLDR